VVSVNLNGQVFYQHQLIREDKLMARFQEAEKKQGKDLKLILQTDKEVPMEVIMRLSGIAQRAGISKIVLAHKPNPGVPL
jgi:biopolymer transport protein ExbD